MRWIALLGAAVLPLSVSADDMDKGLDFEVGRALFERLWVSSPASTTSSDGLGPIYSARSCAACHPGGGRGGDAQLLLRLGAPDPVYGTQIQTRATAGIMAEADVIVTYDTHDVTLGDGTVVNLRKPHITLENQAYGPVDLSGASLRLAPAMAGMGALAGIADATIKAGADPADTDGDGISGRTHDLPGDRIGRFGWQAEEPTLPSQIAAAFSGDIGLGTTLRPAPWGDCTPAQTACRNAPHGGRPEVSDQMMELITYFTANIDAPEPEMRPGAALFHNTGCASCHTPDLDGVPAYTDLLLHEMGPGLATVGQTATEWRTPPLWGIRLTESAQRQTTYLHDGRARSLTEAILWHGGEARNARDTFAMLSAADRADLIDFLEGL